MLIKKTSKFDVGSWKLYDCANSACFWDTKCPQINSAAQTFCGNKNLMLCRIKTRHQLSMSQKMALRRQEQRRTLQRQCTPSDYLQNWKSCPSAVLPSAMNSICPKFQIWKKSTLVRRCVKSVWCSVSIHLQLMTLLIRNSKDLNSFTGFYLAMLMHVICRPIWLNSVRSFLV